MRKFIARFARNETGATSIEYGLIVAGVAIVIVGALGVAGKHIKTTLNVIKKAI